MSQESVSRLLDAARHGDPDVARQLWERYFRQLVSLARQRMLEQRTPRRSRDEEDVALSAFDSVWQGIQQGRFPCLNDRHDLWKILATVIRCKSLDYGQHEHAAKRGGNDVRGESAFAAGAARGEPGLVGVSADAGGLRAPEPTPDEVVAVQELVERLLTSLDDEVREVARWKLSGWNNSEIARHIGKSEALVRVRLEAIQHKLRRLVETT